MVYAGCNNPKGGSSIAQDHTPLLQPPGQFNFTQIRSQNGDVSLRWSSSARTSQYTLFQGTTSTTITTPVSGCTSFTRTICNITGLDPNTVYYFSVKATNAAGTRDITSFGTALSVGSFDITSSSAGDSYIDLVWTNATNATAYNVIYGTSSGAYQGEVTNVTSPYRLSGLTNNVRHYVRVVAVNSQGGYGLSDTEINEQPFGPPGAPAGVTIAATPAQINLTWNSSPGAATYKVFRGTTSGSYTEIANGLTGTSYSDTTVSNGTSYFYVIRGFNGYDSANSAEVSARPIADFNITSALPGPGANQVTVTWPAVTGAATFDVYYGTNSSSLTQVQTGATSPLTFSGLTGGVPYYFRVLARNAVGSGTAHYSLNQLSAVPVALLPAPTGFVAAATPGQIQLNWNAVAGASSYEVLRGTTSGTHTSLATGILATTYTDTTVTNGTAYYYIVRAYNGINGTSSSEVSAKPIASFTISAATTQTNASVQVSWNAGAGADNYDILYGTVSGTYSTTVSNVTSPATISSLSANTTYYFIVRGRNAQGSGTNFLTGELSAKTKTSAPSGLVATATPGSIALDWSNTAGATTYSVYRGTSSGSYTLLSSGIATSDYTDSSAANGTAYYYVVTANNGLESANSSEVAAKAIASFSATSVAALSPTSIQVTWPATSGGDAFDIKYGTSTGTYTTTLTNRTSPSTITGLNGGTTYYLKVVAKNAIGAGTSIDSTNELVQTTPVGPPSGVTATVAGAQITINWTAMPGASSYKVYRGTTSGTYSLLASGIVPTNYVDTTVTAGTQYYYVVKAFNGADSADSSEVTGKTIAPFSLTSVTASSTTSLVVTFPATAGGDAYDVRYGTTSGTYTTTASGVTSPYTITALTANTTYYVVARARNAIGTGTQQTTAEVSIKTQTVAPASLTATSSNAQVSLTWGAVAGASEYRLYRGSASGGPYTLLAGGLAVTNYTDSTVTNGSSYYYVVRAFNGTESANSNEATGEPLATPTISSITGTATTLTVSWSGILGASRYDVRWGTTSGTYTGTTNNVTSPYTITGLSPNTLYYVVVRAWSPLGVISYTSAEVSARTATIAPTGLTATASSGQVGLNWSATTGATSYNVYRGTTSGSLSLLAGSVASAAYLDTTVTNGTTYYYAVSAVNSGGESAQSSEVSVRPIAAFTITSATPASSTSVNVTWPAAAGAATYDVKYGTSAGVYLTTVTGVTSPYTLTGLTPNTVYYLVIQGKNAVGAGTSLNSNEVTFTTATAAPTGVVATSTLSGNASLSWVAATGATNYRIYRGTTSGSYAQIAAGVTGTTYTDTTVTDGTTYYYSVRAFNGTESPDSNEGSVRTIGNFTISGTTAPTSTTIQVTWPAATGATLYDVRYGTTSGSYTTTLSGVTSPHTITGLASGTSYYIVVRARNIIGGTASHQSAEVSQITPIGPPTGLAAVASPGSVALSWTAAGGASSYKVYRGTTSGSYTLLASGVATTTYTDNTAVNGTSYYYALTAFNGADSAYSSEVAVQPIATPVISSVTSPTATSLTVTWGAAAGAATYDVRYGTATGSYTTTVAGQTSPYTITGLSANTTYYVVVRANNAVGAGTTITSAESSRKTMTTAPVGLVASATPGTVGLNWTATTGATSYNVYRGTTSGSLSLLASAVASNAYSDTTVANGTTYYYAVSADNGTESPLSSEVSVRPISSFTISSLTAASSTSFTVAWGAATGAAAYDVRYGTSSGVYLFTVSGVTSPHTVTGLSPNTQYFVSVRARNAVGSGTNVDALEMNVTTATAAPTTLAATATTGQIDLSWTAAAGATNYRIYRGTTSGSYSQIATGVSGTTYSDTTIVNGTQYYYSVRSFNGAESPDSNEATAKSIASFTVGSTTAPTTSTIQVSWTAPAGGDAFDVRYGTTSGTYTTISGVTSPYTITGLSANTTYYIVVRARNTIGLGSSSQTAEVTQKTPTIAPSGLAAAATPGSVALSWTATAGASTYNVYRGTSSGSYSSLATGVATNAYTDSTVANGTTYYYVVTSVNGAESAYSSEVSIRPIATFAITSATTVSTTQIDVTWPAVSGAASYDLKYGTAAGTYTTTMTNQTSPVSLTGLNPGSTYYIVIVAKNAVGSGTSYQSAEVSAQTAFGAPGGIAVTATPGSAVITWSTVSGAATYKIFRSTTSGSYGAALATGLTSPNYTDNTVTNGTTYYYVARAVTSGGADSPDSSEVSIRPISTFTLSSATPTSATTIDLAWTAATGAATYDVRYGTSTGSYTSTLSNQTSPLSVTGLTANTTYYFQVQAKNTVGSGTTVNSGELSAKSATVAPSGLTATATTGQIALSWTPTTGATNYNVYRSTTSGSYGAALATAVAGTTYTDTTVVNGTQYYYTVKANNGIESAASNEATGMSIASFTISATSAPTTSTIQVTWPATSGATAYDVRYGTSTGSYATTVSGVTSPYTITGLTSATTYYIVVRARNVIGSGSSAQTAEVSQVTPLSAPSGLAAASTPGSVALTWTAVSGATSYKVYRSTTSGSYGAALASGVGTNSYTDSTASNGTQYYYVVRAFNGADSADSNEVTTLPMASFAIASTNSPSSSSVQVTWTGPTGAATYDVRYGTATGSYTTTVTGVTSPYTITGLSANTNYYIVIRANNAIGAGTSVTSSESIQKTATGAPTGLAAVASPGSVALTWTAVSGVTDYKIYRGTTAGSTTLLASGNVPNSYTDSTVANGTTYYYAVVANNGSDSAKSSEVSIQPISTFTFSSLVATSSTSATLTWTAATGATTYDVQYGLTSGSYIGTISNVTSPYTNNTLSPNTTYYARIVARNAVGAGTAVNSSERSVTTSPSAPTGLAATVTTSQVALSWTGSAGATAYKIYRGTSTGSYTLLASPAGTGTTYTDSTAVNGTTYFYAVTATNGVESTYSNEVSGQPIASFSITSVVAASTTSLTVTWPATTGATVYDVRYGTSTGSYTTTVSGQTSPYTITGLTSGSTYYVVVRARNTIGATASVQTAEVSAVTPLGAPSGVAATASPGSVGLTWGTVSGATNYRVYRGTTSGSLTLLASAIATTSYSDNTAVNGTTYFYAVTSFNGSESVLSSEVSKQPIANFSISLAGVSSTSIQVSWTNPAGGATYDVRYGTATGSYSTTVSGQTSPYTITGLSANTTYYVIVRANNAVGTATTLNSSESSLKTATGAPSGLVATATPGSVGLTWGSVSGATSYKVYRGTVSGSLSVLASGVGSASYTDNTAANGTTYFYAVLANNGTDSALSSEVSVQPISSFSLTAATPASSTTIDLTWGAATGSAAYDVRYGTSTGVYLWTASNVTSPYTLTGLTAGTRYYISIRARNAVGSGTNFDSNEMNALTAVAGPSGLTATATPGNIALAWLTVSGATNYNVYRSTTSGGPYTQIASAVAALSYNDNTAANGTAYYYVVRSFNGIESANSAQVAAKPIANFTLAAATINSASSVTLSWGAAAGADSYDVRYGTASGSYSTTLTGQTSAYTITGLSSATLYYFVIRANNAIGTGTTLNSNEVSGRTSTAAPTTLAATAGTGTVNLTWVAASGATNYNVYRGTTSGSHTLLASAVSATNYTDSTVANGTTYYYVVRAFNGTESANSNEAAVTPIGSFSISATSATATTIQVTWGAAAGATAYDVKYGTATGSYTTTLSNQTSPYTISGLTGNTTYYIIVTARNGAGGSVNTPEVSQITALGAPSGLVATGGIGQVGLTWTAVSGASSYKVFRGTTSGSLSQIASGVTAANYTDSTAANGTTYFYAVRSFNGTDSVNSAEVSKQPIALPVITAITGNSTTSIQLSWSVPTGATAVDIQYGTSTGTYTSTATGVTSPYSITGLTAGTTYFVRLRATNAVAGGTTVYSSEGSGTPNSAPVLSVVADQQVEANTVHPVNFTLTDANHALTCSGSMTGTSSNTSLLPNGNIVFSGSMPNCTVTLTPVTNVSDTTVVTITANDGISTSFRTFNFTTVPCTIASIVWQQQPTNITAGNAWATAPRVQLRKADGSACTTNFEPVSLEVATDNSVQGDADVDVGTSSVVAVNGIATFTGTGMTRAGTGYTLEAVADGVMSADSNTFNVNASAASRVVFDVQPLATPRSAVMIPNPVVKTADTYGNYVTGAAVNVVISLIDNTEGATLSGTTSRSISTGTATYNNLSVNTVGTYRFRATPSSTYAVVDSDPFDVLTVTPVNTISSMELLQGPMIHPSGTVSYRRATLTTGTNFVDGTVTWYYEFVATNPSTAASTHRLNRGTTTLASQTIPASTTTPTFYRVALTGAMTTTSADHRFYFTGGTNVVLHSARLVADQAGASKSQHAIPLTTIPLNNATPYVTFTGNTAAALPDQNNLVFDWDPAKFQRLNTVQLDIAYQQATSGTLCSSLWNKTDNVQIGAETCGTSTSERTRTLALVATDLPSTAKQLEARFRTTTTGRIYKAVLSLRLVSIENLQNYNILSHGDAALTAGKDYVTNRVYSNWSQYGSATMTGYVNCLAKANTAGVGTFVLRDHNTNNSGTTTTNVSGSTINFSNQAAFTLLENVIATTDTDRMYLNYAHTSGSMNVKHCQYIEEAAY